MSGEIPEEQQEGMSESQQEYADLARESQIENPKTIVVLSKGKK